MMSGDSTLESWSQELFEQNLNSTFEVEVPGAGWLGLELLTLTRQNFHPDWVAFSLLFRGPLERPIGQGLYPTRHARMGQAELFLVPVAREADGMRYEAVFNRPAKS